MFKTTHKDTNLNIFTQAIDESYNNYHNMSVDYYSYEGCNMKDLDKMMLDKSGLQEIDEDNSTIGLFSDEEVHRHSSENFGIKITDYLKSSWIKSLRELKTNAILTMPFNNMVNSRKLSYDLVPELKLDV